MQNAEERAVYRRNIRQNEGAPDSFCPRPWAGVCIQATGAYKPCCLTKDVMRRKDGSPLHIGESDPESAMNSPSMKSIRKDMLAGRWPEECVKCENFFKSGLRPTNVFSRYKFAKDVNPENYPGYQRAKQFTESDGSVSLKQFPLFFLDVSFDNLCNLKCVTCHSGLSSSWLKEDKILFGNSRYDQRTRDAAVKSAVKSASKKPGGQSGGELSKRELFQNLILEKITKHIPDLRRVYVSGGEPLLTKAYYKFLDSCLQAGSASQISIEFNSNITRLPERVFDRMRRFKKIQINMSIDGAGAVNDFCRYPSRWDLIEKNISRFDNETQGNFMFQIHSTFHILNIWFLPEFIEYVMRKNYRRISNAFVPLFYHNPVLRPGFLNTNILPAKAKEKIKKRFETEKKKLFERDWRAECGESRLTNWEAKIKRACDIMDSQIKFMNLNMYDEKELAKHRSGFLYFMDNLDRLRGTDWRKIFPETAEAAEGWRDLKRPDRMERGLFY